MNPLVFLAKQAVENFIKEGKVIEAPEGLPEEFLKKRAGTFVTIETTTRPPRPPARGGPLNGRELRGCIGTYLPTRVNIAEEIIRNAIAAASEDYRFGPIKIEELPYLSYIVYILSYPEPVNDLKTLNPKKFGIIVKTGPFTYPNQENVVFNGVVPYKTGLLLPDLDGVDTAEQQISIACHKAGINPRKERIFIYKFTIEKFQ